MSVLRRQIHPEIRVLDRKEGLVEYVASDETLDSYNEIIRADGWRFDHFSKNAPFVDSHNYGSIDCCIGKVVGFEVRNKQLVETVKWAIDVPDNALAQKGFAMTEAGYLRAVSVGFQPEMTVTPYDNPKDYEDAMAEMGLDPKRDAVRCIYLRQQQKELSACIIGANPNAVAKAGIARAYEEGILNDRDLERWPNLRRAVESERRNPNRTHFTKANSMSSREKLISTIDEITKRQTELHQRATPSLMEQAEKARRGNSEGELMRIAQRIDDNFTSRRRLSARPILLAALRDPEVRGTINGMLRMAGGFSATSEQTEITKRSLTPAAGGLGASLLSMSIATMIWDLCAIYGIWRELSLQPASTMLAKFPNVTTPIQPAAWVTPNNIGGTIATDATLAGGGPTPEMNTLAVLLPVTNELLADAGVDLTLFFLERFSQSLSASLDYACLQGSGANDTVSGLQTGMFIDGTIPNVSAAKGGFPLANLTRTDFVNAVAAIAPAGLQRECKWIISTSFIAPLLQLRDGNGPQYLLKTPAETQDGTWRLCGFEVLFSPQAPNTDAAGMKIAAVGAMADAYSVYMREQIEVMASGSAQFNANVTVFRGITRAFVQTKQASWIATLSEAAN
jgi:HK97 family phage major capsid protein